MLVGNSLKMCVGVGFEISSTLATSESCVENAINYLVDIFGVQF